MMNAYSDMMRRPQFLESKTYTEGRQNSLYEGIICSVGPLDNIALTARVYIPSINQIRNCRNLSASDSSTKSIGSQKSFTIGDKVLISDLYGDSSLNVILKTIPYTAELPLAAKKLEAAQTPTPIQMIPEAAGWCYFGSVVVHEVTIK